jgi:cell wall-associated NlpC family hydrolase
MMAAVLTRRSRMDWRTIEAALADLVGRPFALGGRGPDAFDCWGLVLELRRRLALPEPPDFASVYDVQARRVLFHEERPTGWVRCEPRHGAVVLAERDAHAGVFVAGRIVHASAATGVAAWGLGRWSATFDGLECWEVD